MPVATAAKPPDIAVIGGGIVGLWTAFEAARQGRNVILLEKRSIGSGASGGLLGALMPHQPTGWNAKKQFQLDGLLTLEDEIAALQALTGLDVGYRRCGRLMPIRKTEKRRQSEQWAAASHENWPYPFRWQVADATIHSGWLPPHEMPHGANADNLSARVNPRRMISTLRRALELSGVDIREASGIEKVHSDGRLSLSEGGEMVTGQVVVTAGWETFRLIGGGCAKPAGHGVKGQAALLRPAHPVDPDLPIIYDNGTYAIVHEDGTVAIGSTSEYEFSDPLSTDGRLDAVIDHARSLSPALQHAAVIERWAGIRPKAAGREPLVGPLPGYRNVLVATGGFKISLAIAHLMAKAVLAQLDGQTPRFLPESFLPANRLGISRTGSQSE